MASELSLLLERMGQLNKKQIKSDLSYKTGLKEPQITKALPSVQSAFRGAEVAQSKGLDPIKVGLQGLKDMDPDAPKDAQVSTSKKDISNQEMLIVGLASILPSLIATAVSGEKGGMIAAEGGQKAGLLYMTAKQKELDRAEKQEEKNQDRILKEKMITEIAGKNDANRTHQKTMEGFKEREVKAREKSAENSQNDKNRRIQNSEIKSADQLFKNPAITREVIKINAARSAQKLIEEIRAGKLKDSKNISKQLTNIIATIELGTPGGQGDRESMGISTLYTNVKGLLGYIAGRPTEVIPLEYLDQIETEAYALGDRAATNYKSLTDSSIKGADISLGDEEIDKGNIYKLSRERQKEFLNNNGYNPENAERIIKKQDNKQSLESPVMPDFDSMSEEELKKYLEQKR